MGTGITFQCPGGNFGHILLQSGQADHHGIQVGTGMIDCDYNKEIIVVLFNSSDSNYKVQKGDHIAQ